LCFFEERAIGGARMGAREEGVGGGIERRGGGDLGSVVSGGRRG